MVKTLTIPLDQIKAEICLRSYFEFFKEFWGVIVPDELILAPHIKIICDKLQEIAERVIQRQPKKCDLIINVPPGCSKSTICTQIFPAWCWAKDPTIKIISCSYSATLSTQHAFKSRDVLRSDKFQKYSGNKVTFKEDSDNKTLYENNQGGMRASTSVGGTITGMHAHIILIDDPINPQQAASANARNTANEFIGSTLFTRKVDKKITPTILIMQRLHEKDATGFLLGRNNQIEHICLPAELSVNVKPVELKAIYTDGLLDPQRMDHATLAENKKALGSYAYAGQFDQKPAPDEGGLIKKGWFKKISYLDYKNIPGSGTVNFFLDTAYTNKQKNDPTALMACDYINNILYILASEQVWKELPDLLKHIPSFVTKNDYTTRSRILIEPKASGKSTAQSFKNSTYNVIELPAPVDDKTTRVSNVSPFIEAGRCIIVEGPWNDNFLHEAGVFPNGEHDDQVDNLVNAINYYNRVIFKKPITSNT